MQFLLEADRLKKIERRSFITDASRRENSAEHSWHLALAVMVLGEFAPPNTNLAHAVQIALVHDLVEIDAGDTFVYDAQAAQTQAAREAVAATRLFGMLPRGADFRALWEEFEAKATPEALFVGAVDRMLPVMLNFTTEGRSWKQHNVSVEQARRLVLPALDCAPELRQWVERVFEVAVEAGYLAR